MNKQTCFRMWQLVLLIALLCPALAFAQSIQVSGTVVDQSGLSVIGASILEKGTSNGVITDVDGKFQLSVSPNSTLVISYVGYKTQEIAVKNQTSFSVILKDDTEVLDEVVVVGYGTMKRKDVIGSVENVNTSDLQKAKAPNVATAMQGMVAGVSVQTVSGAPGSTPSISIRGIGTMGVSTPLYIIDGVPGDLAYLDPDDIASLSVLKDGAAAAIYGSRAANGVVLITTKGGQKGAPTVHVGIDLGLKSVNGLCDMLSATEYVDFVKYLHKDAGNTLPQWFTQSENNPNTDWFDLMTRTALSQKYNVSVGGGGENVTYNVSASYMNDEGVMIESYEKRPSIRAKLDFSKGKVKAGINVNMVQREGKSLAYTGESVLTDIISTTPIGMPYDKDGNYMFYLGDGREIKQAHYRNSVFQAKHPDSKYEHLYTSLSAHLDYEILKGLNLNMQGDISNYDSWSYLYRSKYNYGADEVQSENMLSESRWNTRDWQTTVTLNYANSFGKHNMNVLFGHEVRHSKYRELSGSGEGFASDDLKVPDGATKNENISGTASAVSYVSIFGRANYNYDNRYYVSGTIRRDGSSRFSKNNRWGNFPSVAIAWRISNEKFFAPLTSWFTDFKLRASYGQLGNDNIGNYMFQNLLSNDRLYYLYGNQSTAVGGWTIRDIANKNIKWETSISRNIGIDMGFFDNSLTVSIEYFNNITKELLVEKYIPLSNGVNTGVMSNYGKISNKGLELTATYRNYKRAFKWDVTGNLYFLKNKVMRLGTPSDYIDGGSINYTAYFTRTQEGHPLNSFYIYQADGLFRTEEELNAHVNERGEKLQPNAQLGDIRFVDRNKDGVLDDSDRYFAGSPFPKADYSLTFNANYKNFDLMLAMGGSLGYKLINGLKYKFEIGSDTFQNKLRSVLDRWTPDNPDTNVPRIGASDDNNNRRPSTRYLETADYLKVRTIQLGYTLPKNLLQGLSCRFYVSLSNPFTITGYSGPNPEVGSIVDSGNYPLYKTVMFGTSMSF